MGYFNPSFDPATLLASIASLQRKVEPLEVFTVSGGAVSSRTFSDLNGASVIRLEVAWVKGALSNSALFVRPQGITADQLTIYTQGDGAAGSGDLSASGLTLCQGNRGPAAMGIMTLDLTTGRQRTGLSLFGVGGDPATPSSNRNCYGYSLQDDDATVISSVTVECIDLGTSLPVNDMLDGTEIAVFFVR